MVYEFAPLEGVTGHLFRSLHHKYFPGVDRYFAPFYSPSQEHAFTRKAVRDLLPENNEGLEVVPQVLTRRAEDFIWAAGHFATLGYREVNLNLGCPSGTVTAKGKGSGFLAFPHELERFLDKIFAQCTLPISVKTRLGFRSPCEFVSLLALFNQYPIARLIVHPRVRTDFYKGEVRMAEFEWALKESRIPLCYNGDLTTAHGIASFSAQHPTVDAVMLGRGLVGNPALVRQAKGGSPADKPTLQAFHNELYHGYADAFGSRRNASLRMKEFWSYAGRLFQDSDRHLKALRKAPDAAAFERAAASIFHELVLLEDLQTVGTPPRS